MMQVSKKEKKVVWIVSAVLGVLLTATTILNTFYFGRELFLSMDDLLVLSIIVTIFPPAVVNFLDMKWRDEVV